MANTANGLAPQAKDRYLKTTGAVGFDSLPDQLVNKVVAQGFSFNVLCIGETGIGKTTLVETLFNVKLDPSGGTLFNVPHAEQPGTEPPVNVRVQNLQLREGNIRLRLTVAETVGYGDQIDKSSCWEPIVAYIDSQLEAYLVEDINIRRTLTVHTTGSTTPPTSNGAGAKTAADKENKEAAGASGTTPYQDTRVHCCLYLIAPTGHTLKALDLVTMKKLHEKVNLVPIIAKSDTITKQELAAFKTRVLDEIRSYGIDIYQFPADDEVVADSNTATNALMPLAVVASTETVATTSGRAARGRQYPWGVVLVENEAHCDFVRLRESLIRTNLEDLRERTQRVHYERFRHQRLPAMGFSDEQLSLQETYQQRRQLLLAEQQKAEEALRSSFVARIREKEAELKEQEKELHTRFETLKKQHAEDKKRVEEKRRILEEDVAALARRRAMLAGATGGGSSATVTTSSSNFVSGSSTLLKSMKKK